jgi:hypothetical protein
MPPLPGNNLTPKQYYRLGYDDDPKTLAAFPNTQQQAETLLNLTTPAGNNALDEDFDLMQSCFSDQVKLNGFLPIYIHLGNSRGGSWPPDLNSSGVLIGAFPDTWYNRFCVVAEVTEVFMRRQALGWYAGSTNPDKNADGGGNEGDNGEGLSRFLAHQLLIANGILPSTLIVNTTSANNWLSTTRANFITGSKQPLINITPSSGDAIGCTTLFIHYLNGQVGFTPTQIVRKGAPNLQGVWKNLTVDDGDPFPTFLSIVNIKFPGNSVNPDSDTVDNPFPIAQVSFRHGTTTFGKDKVAVGLQQFGGSIAYRGQLFL